MLTKYFIYALTVITCASCQSLTKRSPEEPVLKTPLDTIKSTPVQVLAQPAIFETAFIKGTTQQVNNAPLSFYGVTIGNLKISSGKVIACDPMHIDEYGIPYTQSFPNGEFPVQLAIGNIENAEIIAFARIKFSDEPVVKWEMALLPGQEPLPVGGDEIHGYGIDGSTGLFMDGEAVKSYDFSKSADMDSEVFKAMDKNNRGGWKYTMYNFGNHNLAAFITGFGDGRYASYIGFDAKGQPCRLISDFKIVDWKKK